MFGFGICFGIGICLLEECFVFYYSHHVAHVNRFFQVALGAELLHLLFEDLAAYAGYEIYRGVLVELLYLCQNAYAVNIGQGYIQENNVRPEFFLLVNGFPPAINGETSSPCFIKLADMLGCFHVVIDHHGFFYRCMCFCFLALLVISLFISANTLKHSFVSEDSSSISSSVCSFCLSYHFVSHARERPVFVEKERVPVSFKVFLQEERRLIRQKA